MYFRHASEIWRDYPELVPGVLVAHGITGEASAASQITRFNATAASRLSASSEGELPEIQAWRRAFSRMGLKPTQYRCAAEALLRRFRKDKSLPQIHPLIDLCNAISLVFAIPIAVFDIAEIANHLEVRYAGGHETYLTFSGDVETPEPHEVIFADAIGRAHARRWTNRQSAYSAVRPKTRSVLIVAEAMHAAALEDMQRLIAAIRTELDAVWSSTAQAKILDPTLPQFDF